MIYFVFDALLFLFGVFFLTSISKVSKSFIVIVFFLLLVLFGGLRYNVGKDWESYSDIFNSIDAINLFQSGVEPLYSLLVFLIKCLGFSYLGSVFAFFALSTAIKFYYIYKYALNFFASLLVYFPIQFMAYDINVVRQGLACAVLFASIKYLLRRKLTMYLIICFIAVGFHYSAIIFIPFYFFSNHKFSKRSIHLLLLGSLVIGFIFQKIILDYILPQLGGIESIFANKVLSYSADEQVGSGINIGFSTIHRIFIFYIFIYYYDKIKISEDFKNLLLNAYLFSLIIYFLFSAIEIVGARGSFYYRSMDIFIIASFLSIKKDFGYKLFILTIIFGYSLLGIYTNLKIPFNGLEPYDNLLFHLI